MNGIPPNVEDQPLAIFPETGRLARGAFHRLNTIPTIKKSTTIPGKVRGDLS